MHLEKLRATETTVDYQHKLHQELESYNVERCNTNDIAGCTIDRIWSTIRNAILNVEKAILGPRPKRGRNEWFDQECLERIEGRNNARKNYIERPTRAKWRKYKKARKEAKRIIRIKKRKHLNSIVQMQ